MRQLRPVDIVVDFDVPASGFFADETMDGPTWGTDAMTQTFFGRRNKRWYLRQAERGHLYFDGKPLIVPRTVLGDQRAWRLVDVERFAHLMAEQGKITVEQLLRALEIIRAVCESWGYIEARPVPTRAEDHDPGRTELYAVSEEPELTDDIDDSPGAYPRTFALGDVTYHLDLTDEHWNDVLAAMAPYVKIARRSTGADRKKARQADRGQVRAWALKQGYPIGARGRIPIWIMDAYLQRPS